jgi:hypothetical protein
MLQNLTNFFNLITNRKIKKTLDNKDLLAIGTPDARFDGGYQPTAISYEDLEAQIAAGITPATPTLQAVVNAGNSITNFGGIGNASISSINFVNNRALYLNTDSNPAIRIVDNLNAANNLQIDIDTLTLDGVSYNWSSIVNQGLPAWVETNAVKKTIWCNGLTNNGENTCFGEDTFNNLTSGTKLTAFGISALSANSSGSFNTAFGSYALQANTTGSDNNAFGVYALWNNTTGSYNTAIGDGTLTQNTNGAFNTACGTAALNSNTAGSSNVAIGSFALNLATANSNNIAIGKEALQNTNGSLANSNIGIGNIALKNNTTGSQNTALGSSALTSNTTGIDNVAIGGGTASTLTTGSNNTVVGTQATPINFSGSVILGKGAAATANNQFVVGSAGTNAGSVLNTPVLQSHVWNVVINGTSYKILLAA